MINKSVYNLIISSVLLISFTSCNEEKNWELKENGNQYSLITETYEFRLTKENAIISFDLAASGIHIPGHDTSGFYFQGSYAQRCELVEEYSDSVYFSLENANGDLYRLIIIPKADYMKMSLLPVSEADTVASKTWISTGGISPAFGMGEHSGYPMHPYSPASTDITGYSNDSIIALVGNHFVGRMISNFVIFPQHNFAGVNIEPMLKIGRFTKDENTHGSWDGKIEEMYYFFGELETIYRSFLLARNKEGYPVMKPKYKMFGLGWEAWGALGWKTNQKTVTNYVSEFLENDYPLQWVVVGSGFWPHHDSSYMATTSFGMWDPDLYPNPREMTDFFHKNDLVVLIGLRIAFLEGGPFTDEGLEKGYFMPEGEGQRFYRVGFPKGKVYLLEGRDPEAVEWYLDLCGKWFADGIDGFKEDLYGHHWDVIPDSKCNLINERLMKQGKYVLGRNNYLGSAMDLHRIEDFNYNHQLDRGPISALNFSYSGLPFVYPDVVGGEPYYSDEKMADPGFQEYMVRFGWFASLSPSMGIGMGPWNFKGGMVPELLKKAALFHDTIQPYIYSEALKTVETGFPYTMTPLPLKYPDDPLVYNREDTITRGFQWMIGESLLAAPLFGDDYEKRDHISLYVPEGKWIHYETGEMLEGPKVIDNYHVPVERIPVFVGGNGILLLKDGEDFKISVYPVAEGKVSETFTLPDGESKVNVIIDTDTFEKDLLVSDPDGDEITPEKNHTTGAVSFSISSPGDYVIK